MRHFEWVSNTVTQIYSLENYLLHFRMQKFCWLSEIRNHGTNPSRTPFTSVTNCPIPFLWPYTQDSLAKIKSWNWSPNQPMYPWSRVKVCLVPLKREKKRPSNSTKIGFKRSRQVFHLTNCWFLVSKKDGNLYVNFWRFLSPIINLFLESMTRSAWMNLTKKCLWLNTWWILYWFLQLYLL